MASATVVDQIYKKHIACFNIKIFLKKTTFIYIYSVGPKVFFGLPIKQIYLSRYEVRLTHLADVFNIMNAHSGRTRTNTCVRVRS